ncbi:MAG: helix-turn-helix domain-containing protein [Gammaproteobacteria bacterium]|nr:helix-turn-helix domain-containing protein [Gammaproteobacteria bacterium]MCD8543011.1 helix-turn-helix domain-containing protein [Gammaproteobacteria bacterium]
MPETNQKAYEYFRMAREHRGQSIAEVAHALYLNVGLLEQIEMGNFSSRRFAPVFMRGYVRSYAKYLQLSEVIVDEIMASFDGAPPTLSVAVRTKQAILKKQPLNRCSVKKTFSYSIIVFLLLLGAFFGIIFVLLA